MAAQLGGFLKLNGDGENSGLLLLLALLELHVDGMLVSVGEIRQGEGGNSDLALADQAVVNDAAERPSKIWGEVRYFGYTTKGVSRLPGFFFRALARTQCRGSCWTRPPWAQNR